MDKLGLYISNLMTTIIDNEEKFFNRKLAFDELERLHLNVSSFLLKHISKFDGMPDELKEKDTKQLILEFGEKHEDK